MKKQFIITYTSLSIGWLLLMIAIFSIILSSCTKDNISGSGHVVSETRSISALTDVEVSGDFEVHLKQAAVTALEIKAEDNIIGVVETGVRGNTLYVRIRERTYIKNHLPIKVYIQSPIFQRLQFDGSGTADNQDTIRSSLFKYEINGSGKGWLTLTTTNLTTTINGSGDMVLKGNADTHNSEINGSGSIAGIDMEVQKANIAISGSGEHEAFVRQYLDVDISGSGEVHYKGEPIVVSNIVGSGKVVKQ
ncbi:head GIN domain-containing protein [Chitinophaga sp. RAB17]|uniref:head GIN domain-containing protein n=1 Tax=Chitinophaga sp. RAB17 TaxID=3233049 RepID=UPI003F92C6F6